ncbi:MAG TPA: PAS-domain containing protein [Alphaproteobacteria bacterium]|nr:PAS-domain containing protein [Alphaproteobacteria bacterium]
MLNSLVFWLLIAFIALLGGFCVFLLLRLRQTSFLPLYLGYSMQNAKQAMYLDFFRARPPFKHNQQLDWRHVFAENKALNKILLPLEIQSLEETIRHHSWENPLFGWYKSPENQAILTIVYQNQSGYWLMVLSQPDLSNFYHQLHQYQYILNNLPLPIWARQADLKITYCNQAYANIVGRDLMSVMQEQLEILPNQQGNHLKQLAQRSLNFGLSQSESQYIVFNGKRLLFDIHELVVSDHFMKKQMATVGYGNDVTALEDLQNRLSQQIGAHAETLENLDTGIAIYSGDGRIRFFNKAYTQIFALSNDFLDKNPVIAEVLEQLRHTRRIPEQVDFVQYKKDVSKIFLSVVARHQELWHLSDGSTLRLQITPHPFGGILMQVDDVTDRLTLERSYNTLIDVQRASLDHLHEAVAVFGSDGRLKLANATYRKDWHSENLFSSATPHISEVAARFQEKLLPVTEKSTPHQSTEIQEVVSLITNGQSKQGQAELKDGRVFQYAVEPLPDGSSLFSYLDISDSFRAAEALKQRNEALETADKMKTAFLANVSYELRTPLNAIVGFGEMLQNGYAGQLNAAQQKMMITMMQASTQLTKLIDDVLDITAIEAGYLDLTRTSVNLSKLLDIAVQTHQPIAQLRQITIQVTNQINQAWTYGDEKRLLQVITVFLTNAIQRSPLNGLITVTLNSQLGLLVLSFTDQGTPLSSQEQQGLFEKFVATETRKKPGAAQLSLALARQLVLLHQGSISVASSSTTTITCNLPDQRLEGDKTSNLR